MPELGLLGITQAAHENKRHTSGIRRRSPVMCDPAGQKSNENPSADVFEVSG